MTLFLEFAVAALYALALFLLFAWQKGRRNSALLSDLLVLVIVDDKMRARHRAAMMEFVSGSNYPSATALATTMTTGFCKIAAAPATLRSTSDCLEQLHRGSQA